MALLNRISQFFKGKKPSGRRAFKGALNNGLTFDWTTSNTSANSELRRDLKTLRFRSRELERNNDYVRSFLGMVSSQVIGPDGIGLQMQIKNDNGSPDTFANNLIESEWKKWKKKGTCTMDGRLSFQDAERLFIRTIARDGEILVREIKGNQSGNDFGYAIQFVEVDHLDEDDVRKLVGDRKVYMGVETNEWNRPQAYHIWTHHPGDEFLGATRRDRVRVSANDMIHPFIMERPGQTRGMPWFVSAMLRLQMLGGYEEAELVAARVSAAKMGFFTSGTGDEYDGDGEDEQGRITMEAEPGSFEQLPTGVKLESWKPEHPTTAFDAFHKAMLRGVAASIGLSYPSLSGDLENVNFSSLRQGALNERDMWKVIQSWATCNFHTPIFEAWLEMSLTTGVINLPPSKFDKFNAPKWQPRGWQWVDPQKEAAGNIAAMDAGLKSRTQILAETGIGFEDFLDTLVQERVLMESKGAQIESVSRPQIGVIEDDE